MNTFDVLGFLVVGALLGATGQGARVVVGLKKGMESAAGRRRKPWFDGKRLLVSLLIGACAGVLGAIGQWGSVLDKEFMVSVVTIGYSGTDFLEGFIRREA